MTAQIEEPLLIVYDSRAIRETIALLGPSVCRQVVELDTPDDTLDIIACDRPALVVLCAMTAKTRAYSLCREIKQRYPGPALPVMILALQDPAESRRRAAEAGADDALQLSISAEELLAHIRALLAARPKDAERSPEDTARGAFRAQIGAAARSLGDLAAAVAEHEANSRRLVALLESTERRLRDLQRSVPRPDPDTYEQP